MSVRFQVLNSYPTALVLLAIAFTIAVHRHFTRSYAKQACLPFPPGPKPKYLIGNIFDMPTGQAALCYAEWGKKYNSDILHASIPGYQFLILNSFKDAEELLERRAGIHSGRPTHAMAEFIGWEGNAGFISPGKRWRTHRSLAQQHFRHEVIHRYHSILIDKTRRMLRALLETPQDFMEHSKLLTVSTMMAVMYGKDLDSVNDPYITGVDENTIKGQALVTSFTLINIIPFLRHIPSWLPGASSQRKIREIRNASDMLKKAPMMSLEQQLKDGTAPQSVVTRHFEERGSTKEDQDTLTDFAFTIYGAASDTTIGATSMVFYLFALHPEVQQKAQAEIDAIVGTDRLPTFDDRPRLPYIEAIYREVLRWGPPGRVGFPHTSSQDDVYRGYFIPKGTSIIANIWLMCRDENKYPEPHAFKPERFLDENGQLNNDDRILAYGFGRRICFGKHFASASMWLTIVSVLAAFNILKAKDEYGNEIEIKDDEIDYGLITHKAPFVCSILPRSKAARRLIEETANVDI